MGFMIISVRLEGRGGSSQRLSNLIQLGSFATGPQITQRTNAHEMIFGAENIQGWEIHVLHQ